VVSAGGVGVREPGDRAHVPRGVAVPRNLHAHAAPHGCHSRELPRACRGRRQFHGIAINYCPITIN
jgi:hypothetical protein